jgi:hypothetical protein
MSPICQSGRKSQQGENQKKAYRDTRWLDRRAIGNLTQPDPTQLIANNLATLPPCRLNSIVSTNYLCRILLNLNPLPRTPPRRTLPSLRIITTITSTLHLPFLQNNPTANQVHRPNLRQPRHPPRPSVTLPP